MKGLTLISVSIIVLTNLIYSQSVEIKDSADQLLLQINDEGDGKSSITLPSGGAPGDPASKLYNEGSILKWSGTTLATGSSLWTLSSGNVYRETGNVGIGTVSSISRLTVGGEGVLNATIYGKAIGNGGYGVYGIATFNNPTILDTTRGGYFKADAKRGIGVQGVANNINGRGVYGEANGNSGYGVIGTSEGSNGYGVFGKATGYSGKGVFGEVQNSGNGETQYGGFFKASGSRGNGVYGWATHSSGVNYGVKGKTNSPSGYGGYFEGRGYFSDNVGIGTTNPVVNLQIDGNDGFLVQSTYNVGTIQNLGAGTRMHFYPKKAAFRVGGAEGTEWDDVNIGGYSTAMGVGTTASGHISTAMGNYTTASGSNSTAMGWGTIASGTGSTAIGREIQASGDYSVAIALNDQNLTNLTQANTMAIMGGNVGINTTTPTAKLDVSGDVILGDGGSRFLEIQEITGTTGVSNAVTITNALPVGWTGTTTRVLSFEIQYGSATGNWVTSGNDFINTQPSISASLGYNSRTIILYYPDLPAYQNQNWRMVVMRMP